MNLGFSFDRWLNDDLQASPLPQDLRRHLEGLGASAAVR
jgi:hypothetical protein